MSAKYYIYRNLHKGGFSVRLRGRVVDYIDEAVCMDVSFKVGLKGRERVLKEGRKNVHAYIVCDTYHKGGRLQCMFGKMDEQVQYFTHEPSHPYFFTHADGEVKDAFMCHLKDEKVYIR